MVKHIWGHTKQLFLDLTPLGAVWGSITLVKIHETISIFAILLTCTYTFFKIKKDFFNKK